MQRFVYKAKDPRGRSVEREVSANSEAEAMDAIMATGLTPVWLRRKVDASRPRPHGLLAWRISVRDVTVFTRQLASLVRSRVPILKALATIADQTESAAMGDVVEQLALSVRNGKMLSGSMSEHPRCFSELYINMVRSGESAGILDSILLRLADAREKEEDIRKQIQAAMAYPILILVVGLATIFVLFAFFLPRVVGLFRDYKDLPLPTRLLIGISDFFSAHWYWLALAILLLWALFKGARTWSTSRTALDTLRLRLPLLGRYVRESEIARFARTFSLLAGADVPVERAIALSAATLGNSVLRAAIEQVRDDTVRHGMPLSEGMKRQANVLPAFVSNMVAVGEEAGRLDESMAEVASYFEKEVERQSRLATSLLEPVLILVVGAVVGFIVSAMLMPIFQIGGAF